MTTAIILTSLLALVFAFFFVLSGRCASKLKADCARFSERCSNLERENSRLKAELENLSERQHDEFQLLARQIVDSQSQTIRQTQNRELGAILTPLREQIEGFRSKIEQCYSAEARERFSLTERIRELIETNNSMGRQARELSEALRGNSKTQGDWGELVLETLLEKSGLRRGEEFETQLTRDDVGSAIRNESGALLRPDVVVRYPDRGCMVIDSKVSLSAFTEMVNASDDDERHDAARRHLASVEKHIRELSDKKYEEYIGNTGKLDFVMMFIPNEGAYSTALQLDPSLWEKAYSRRVIIASPTQLMGALRIVAQMWRHDRQAKNAAEIARSSGLMYDKFAAFVDDILKVERSLEATASSLADAKKKLCEGKGNLVSRAEKLRQLGVKTSRLLSLEASDD